MMPNDIQEQSFRDGFAVGELTGKLKYQMPTQVKQWVELDKVKDFKGVLKKYHYSITGVSAHPSEPDQVLLIADKVADGTDPELVEMFAKSDRFMDGWFAGCLSGMLRYAAPERVEEWVRVENLDVVRKIVHNFGYSINSLRLHTEEKEWGETKRWVHIVAERDDLE